MKVIYADSGLERRIMIEMRDNRIIVPLPTEDIEAILSRTREILENANLVNDLRIVISGTAEERVPSIQYEIEEHIVIDRKTGAKND